jgi:hypothetical protein
MRLFMPEYLDFSRIEILQFGCDHRHCLVSTKLAASPSCGVTTDAVIYDVRIHIVRPCLSSFAGPYIGVFSDVSIYKLIT